ncbi:MAG: UPF0175 family protein [Promethearchaeia archaeon]
MKEYRMREAGEKFRKGLVSLAEAANLAEVSIYEMMEYIDREKIRSASLSEEEMEVELKESKHLFKKIRVRKNSLFSKINRFHWILRTLVNRIISGPVESFPKTPALSFTIAPELK